MLNTLLLVKAKPEARLDDLADKSYGDGEALYVTVLLDCVENAIVEERNHKDIDECISELSQSVITSATMQLDREV